MSSFEHMPVMLGPALDGLKPAPGGIYMDGTLGLGGHAQALLDRSAPDGILHGFDQDAQALAGAKERLAGFGDRVRLLHGNFALFDELNPSLRENALDGALVDLGVSSMQLMDPGRGFSFMREGPLDMRMDLSQNETALTYLRHVSSEELEERLREAGEDRFAGKLTERLLVRPDDFQTTKDLADAVARWVPRRGKSHPATRVFLALRLAVNREMENLRVFLDKIPAALKPGGRLAVITFHSTEDRVVKRFFKEHKPGAGMKAVNKSPLIPSWNERKSNPRSRSAKLRVFEKTV